MILPLLVILSMFGTPAAQKPAGIRVAVASNFSPAMKAIAKRFEIATGCRVTLVFGSSGKHYAQIRNGAPLDAFFSADAERPELLEREALAQPGTRFTYAIGKIVLWSPRKGYVDSGGTVLAHGSFRHLAIANPKLAPYGKAAQQVLHARGIWADLEKRLVMGEDVGQAYQFVRSGNAELGFVALSQVTRPGSPISGSSWVVPQSLYTPIEQQAVQLSARNAVREFMSFVRGREARAIIQDHGYAAP